MAYETYSGYFLFSHSSFAYNLPIRSIDKTKNLEVLADSARHLLGKSGFVPVNTAWMQLARDLNDSIQMEAAYSELFDHYYRLGEVDSLRIVGYELMDWYTRRNKRMNVISCGVITFND